MRYPAYEDYKDSGVEWLDELPQEWEVKKLKFVALVQPSNVDKKTHEGEEPVYLCNYTDVYYNEEITSDLTFMKATASKEQIKKFTLRSGDTIITKDSEDPNDIAVPTYIPEDLDGIICGYHLAMLRPVKGIYGSYLKRVMDSHYARSVFATRANGLTRYGLGTSAIKDFLLPLPSIEEQRQIAAFLDRETAVIDTLIAKQEELIRLLGEKRTAVISHAVTKGLNPHAPMKDSGIEWLGQIPAHWEVKRLRYLGQCQNGINIGAEYFGSGYPFVSYGDVYNHRELPHKASGLVQSSDSDRIHYSVEAGDIFFTRTSETIEEIGFSSACMQTIEDATFAGFLIRFRPSGKSLNPKFSKFYFQNILLRAFFVKEMNLVTRASLSQDLLKKMPVLIPSLDEQDKIVQYLEDKTTKIDSLITRANQAITLLKERRTALISAAVTGKIDVRHASPQGTPS
jgi:type I restriction enzyme S subunit